METIKAHASIMREDLFSPRAKDMIISRLSQDIANQLAHRLILPSPDVVPGPSYDDPFGIGAAHYHIKLEYRQLQT